MAEIVPDYLRGVYDELTSQIADLDTLIARAHETPVPTMAPTDPKQLAEAADLPSAPAELRAVARAVAEGRTSWAEVAEGGARDLPEVQALQAASVERLGQELEAVLAAERAGKPAQRPAPTDDDFPPPTTLHDAW